MADLTGRWAGQLVGTNAGNIFLQLAQEGLAISGTLRFNDLQFGIAVYSLVGAVGEKIDLKLTPTVTPEGMNLGPAQAEAVLDEDTLSGDWETEQGTAGTFVAYRQRGSEPLRSPRPNRPATSRNVDPDPLDLGSIGVQAGQRQRRIPVCSLDSPSLKRIFRNLEAASKEAVQLEIAAVRANPHLLGTVADPARVDLLMQDYERRVKNLNAVGISIEGANGEHTVSFDQSALDPDRLPKSLRSISLETGLLYRTSHPAKNAPNRAVIVFDFTKPPAFDIANPSGTPTPNNSMLFVAGSNTTWVSGVYSNLEHILSEQRNRWDWLHGTHTYDLLLFVVGLPSALSMAGVVSNSLVFNLHMDPLNPFRTAITVYVFFATLYVFRIGFSLIRWLYPHVELSYNPRPLHLRLRTAIVAVLLGIPGSLIAAGVMNFFGG